MYSNSAHSRTSHTAAANAGLVTIAAIGSFLLWKSTHPRKRNHDRRLEIESSHDEGSDRDVPKQKQEQQRSRRLTLQDQLEENGGILSISPIGHVRSVYRLCVGTPRQGLLAPNARGRIEVAPQYIDALDGLQGFSHVWIVFAFHLNTVSKSSSKSCQTNTTSTMKIAPPALGGKKVGVLASRSPHRPNPVGITLCKLDQVLASQGVLTVTGLDLVDSTPVYDIKPYVSTYDSLPPTISTSPDVQSSTVPSWVSDGLATRRPVHILPKALHDLQQILETDPNALDFYRGASALDDITKCIEQVLSVDVRSAWQTKKARRGQSQAERAERLRRGSPTENSAEANSSSSKTPAAVCTQQLDNLLIHFTVSAPETSSRSASEGSGAEDTVLVHSIQLFQHEKVPQRPRVESRELQVPIMPEINHASREKEAAKEKAATAAADASSVEKAPDPPGANDPPPKQSTRKQQTKEKQKQDKEEEEGNGVIRTNDGLEKENKPIQSEDTRETVGPANQAQRREGVPAASNPTSVSKSATSTSTSLSPTLRVRSPSLKSQSPKVKARSPSLKARSPSLRSMNPRGATPDSPSVVKPPNLAFSTIDTSSSLLQTHSSSASLSSLAPDAVASPTLKPKGAPKPKDAEYNVLKTYWNKAAQKNTPKGLIPEAGDELAKSSSASTKKLFGGVAKSGSFGAGT